MDEVLEIALRPEVKSKPSKAKNTKKTSPGKKSTRASK
jgi:hypothetical protein